MRPALRPILLSLLCLTLAGAPAQAASTATSKAPVAPVVTAPPQTAPAPGSAFGPIQPLGTGATPTPTTTTINTTRPGSTGLGRGPLLLLVGVSFLLIIGVGFLIWYEGKTQREIRKKRRQRVRSGRTPQTVGAEARRGPPPPPRKRRAAAKKRKR